MAGQVQLHPGVHVRAARRSCAGAAELLRVGHRASSQDVLLLAFVVRRVVSQLPAENSTAAERGTAKQWAMALTTIGVPADSGHILVNSFIYRALCIHVFSAELPVCFL